MTLTEQSFEQIGQIPPLGSGKSDAVPERRSAAPRGEDSTWQYEPALFVGSAYTVPAMPMAEEDRLTVLRALAAIRAAETEDYPDDAATAEERSAISAALYGAQLRAIAQQAQQDEE